MTTLDKEAFLDALEAVRPGVANRERIEYSSLVAFRAGRLLTFEGAILCSCPSGLPEAVTGSVSHDKLTSLLKRLPEGPIQVDFDPQLSVRQGKRRFALDVESKLSPHFDSVESPGEFRPLDDCFADGLALVRECAGEDADKYFLTCVHLHPDYVEAGDNLHMARYRVASPLDGRCLISKDAAKHLVSMGPCEVADGAGWVHFRAPTGAVMSIRKEAEVDKYRTHEMTRLFEFVGQPVGLPKELAESAEAAQVCSSENADDDAILVRLREGKAVVNGVGVTCWYQESVRGVRYDGPDLDFMISPALLAKVVREHAAAQVGENFLKVEGGRWTYLTALGRP